MNEKQRAHAAKTLDLKNLTAGNVAGETIPFNLPNSFFYAFEFIIAIVIVLIFGPRTLARNKRNEASSVSPS